MYKATTAGNFHDVVSKFQSLLLSITLLVIDDKQKIAEVSMYCMLVYCRFKKGLIFYYTHSHLVAN